MLGTFGVAAEEIGRFNRTLPPKTKVQYDSRWELGLEVVRWFHYRYGVDFNFIGPVKSVQELREMMTPRYQDYFISKGVPKKTMPFLTNILIEPRIQEFCELFKDVLAEIELLREAQ